MNCVFDAFLEAAIYEAGLTSYRQECGYPLQVSRSSNALFLNYLKVKEIAGFKDKLTPITIVPYITRQLAQLLCMHAIVSYDENWSPESFLSSVETTEREKVFIQLADWGYRNWLDRGNCIVFPMYEQHAYFEPGEVDKPAIMTVKLFAWHDSVNYYLRKE